MKRLLRGTDAIVPVMYDPLLNPVVNVNGGLVKKVSYPNYVGAGDKAAHAAAGLILDLHSAMATGTGPGNGTLATWKDLSGNGLNAALNNVAYTTSSGWDNGLVTDGVDDFAQIDSNILLNPTAITLEMWFTNLAALGSSQFVLGKGGGSSFNLGYGFANYFGQWGFWINGNANMAKIATPGYGSLVQWVGTYDGANIILYRNGTEVNRKAYTSAIASTTLPFSIGRISLGADGGSTYFTKANYKIVREYNRALTAAEVLQNYNCGVTW